MATAAVVRAAATFRSASFLFVSRCFVPFGAIFPHLSVRRSSIGSQLEFLPLLAFATPLSLCCWDPFVLRQARYAAGGGNEG